MSIQFSCIVITGQRRHSRTTADFVCVGCNHPFSRGWNSRRDFASDPSKTRRPCIFIDANQHGVRFKSTRCLLWFRGSGIGFQLRDDKIDRKGLNQPAICCSLVVVVAAAAATEVAGWQDSNSNEGATTGRQQSTGCLLLCRDSNRELMLRKRQHLSGCLLPRRGGNGSENLTEKVAINWLLVAVQRHWSWQLSQPSKKTI